MSVNSVVSSSGHAIGGATRRAMGLFLLNSGMIGSRRRGVPLRRAACAFACLASLCTWNLADACDESCGRHAGTLHELVAPPAERPVPSPSADFEHMKLEILLPDMDIPRAEVVQTLTFAPLADRPTRELRLDARMLEIASVELDGQPVDFQHDGWELRVSLPAGGSSLSNGAAAETGSTRTLVTRYSIIDPPDGLFWTLPSPEWPGRPAQIHTQGQPESNSYWFPCHDYPNERLTTEVIVTAPKGFLVSSNGRLVSKSRAILDRQGPGDSVQLGGFDRWHWLQDKPHAVYLVSLVVGQFDVVDVGDKRLSMPVYVPPGRAKDVPGTYGRTLEMTRFFEGLLDEPYPWDRYAQLVVWNFVAGGMENTSATTMFDTAIIAPDELDDHSLEGLISHELAHQWFGDLVTCREWAHIWINEGWATYMTHLWNEHAQGRDAYFAGIQGSIDAVVERDRPSAPDQPPLVSEQYFEPDEVFRKAANPYSKGAAILHMLRMKMGDAAFFKGVAAFLDRHRLGLVTTDDFREALQPHASEDLRPFFDQWCLRPGVPKIEIAYEHDASAGVLRVRAKQIQAIDERNPAFAVRVPLWIGLEAAGSGAGNSSASNRSRSSEGNANQTGPRGLEAAIEMIGAEASIEIPLTQPPAYVAADPLRRVLADYEVDQTASAWIAQLRTAPDVLSRLQAARGLGGDSSARGAEALRRAAARDGEAMQVRVAAATALGIRGNTFDLETLAPAGLRAWELRRAIAGALGKAASRENAPLDEIKLAADKLVSMARNDSSTEVRGEAVRSLGKIRAGRKVLLTLAEQDSQHDELRQATLDAMASFDVPDSLKLARQLAAPGYDSRTRAKAMETIAKVATHQPDQAFQTLASYVNDREPRAREAARRALVQLKDPRGLELLRTIAASTRDRNDQARINRWLAE
ncbi:MAG: M1 family metallopeptidase [Planctomycetota bacterium]|nr:M1 family metallopeptidase [Planctomycetota bacterium]